MVHPKSIWESMNGPSEVGLGFDLRYIKGMFGVHFGPTGVHFGVQFESMLRSDSDFGLRSPRDQMSKALGPILTLLLDPMLAPCWLHVGGGRAS